MKESALKRFILNIADVVKKSKHNHARRPIGRKWFSLQSVIIVGIATSATTQSWLDAAFKFLPCF